MGDGKRREDEGEPHGNGPERSSPAPDYPVPTAYSPRGWAPVAGERVRLVTNGEVGTVVRLAPTEWGLLCDVEFDPPSAPGRPARRTHAANELRPLT